MYQWFRFGRHVALFRDCCIWHWARDKKTNALGPYVCDWHSGAYPATAGGGGRGGGGGGSGRAVPRCRHIGCVVSHGAAAVSCCVRVIGTCVTCVGCAGRATMTRRGGGASESVPRHMP